MIALTLSPGWFMLVAAAGLGALVGLLTWWEKHNKEETQ